MKYAAIFSVIAVGLVLGPANAVSAPTERIGSTVQVVNEVSAAYDQDRRDLTLGDEIHQNELIEVGPDSIGELEFEDQTKMALGPGSKIVLDTFVYNGAKTKGDIAVELVKGAFRFVTGVATKPSYRIKTPGAAITVRGTIFDVYVLTDNSAWFLLLDGGITACNDGGTCKQLSKPGNLLRVSPDGEVSDPMRWALLPGRDQIGFARAFPFMINAPTINPNPPLTREAVLRDESAPKKKSKPKKKKKAKKKTKSKPKKKVTKKKTYPKKRKKVVKKRRKKKRRASNKAASDAAKAAIAIGIGIGIGKMIGNGKGGGRKECMRVGGCRGKGGGRRVGGGKRGGRKGGGHSHTGGFMRY